MHRRTADGELRNVGDAVLRELKEGAPERRHVARIAGVAPDSKTSA